MPKFRVKNVQTTEIAWAYVDALGGRAELVKTKNIFCVTRKQKLPFLPQNPDDFDHSRKYVEKNGSSSRTVFIKLLASK